MEDSVMIDTIGQAQDLVASGDHEGARALQSQF